MRAKSSLPQVTAVFLALALGFAWYGFHAARQSATALAVLTQERVDLSLSLQRKERALASERPARVQGASAASTTSAAPHPTAVPSQAALLAANPKLFDLYLKSFRSNLFLRFGPFYRAFGFSQEKIDRFEEISTTGEAERLDLQAVTEAEGMSPSDPGILALRQQQREEGQAAFLHDFGVRATMEIVGAKRLAPLGGVITDLAGDVVPKSTVFPDSQTSALLQILQNSSPSYQAGGMASAESINWTTAAAQAGTVLSGPLLEAIQARAQSDQLNSLLKQFYAQQPAAVQ